MSQPHEEAGSHEEAGDARTMWEAHYEAKPQVWSGRVNAQLAEIAPRLPVGRALDLGCGEGADALWLAERGWTVVGTDISETALARARAAAQARGLAGRIEFRRDDLDHGFPDGVFDLVSAQFLHSPAAMNRAAILRRAADAVAPGGALLIVDHGAAPPWAAKLHHHEFPGPEEVLAGLDLDPAWWERIRVDSVERAARGPDGQDATLLDNVIWLRKVASATAIV